MKRIVFDCDRCGAREAEPIYSRYSTEGTREDDRLGLEEFAGVVEHAGVDYGKVGELLVTLMEGLEQQKNWFHFCDSCFRHLTKSVHVLLDLEGD